MLVRNLDKLTPNVVLCISRVTGDVQKKKVSELKAVLGRGQTKISGLVTRFTRLFNDLQKECFKCVDKLEVVGRCRVHFGGPPRVIPTEISKKVGLGAVGQSCLGRMISFLSKLLSASGELA